ncbi:hypothetical protein AB1N83_014453 [Pleurotus pulmonarius]
MGGHALSFTRLLLSISFYLRCSICLLSCCVQTCYRSLHLILVVPPLICISHTRSRSNGSRLPHVHPPHLIYPRSLINNTLDWDRTSIPTNFGSLSACPFYELSCAYLQL